jgi:hypothetical protein
VQQLSQSVTVLQQTVLSLAGNAYNAKNFPFSNSNPATSETRMMSGKLNMAESNSSIGPSSIAPLNFLPGPGLPPFVSAPSSSSSSSLPSSSLRQSAAGLQSFNVQSTLAGHHQQLNTFGKN